MVGAVTRVASLLVALLVVPITANLAAGAEATAACVICPPDDECERDASIAAANAASVVSIASRWATMLRAM